MLTQAIRRRLSQLNVQFLLEYLDSRLNCAVQNFGAVKCLNNIQIWKFQILVKVDILEFSPYQESGLAQMQVGE